MTVEMTDMRGVSESAEVSYINSSDSLFRLKIKLRLCDYPKIVSLGFSTHYGL